LCFTAISHSENLISLGPLTNMRGELRGQECRHGLIDDLSF